jgi:hypothetical protein
MMPESINPASNSAPAATVRAAASCYLVTPALSDVLNEQMEYLLGHAEHHAAGCADCARLAQVVQLLMQPFA